MKRSSRLTINRIASAGIRADKKGYAALAVGIMLSIFFITSLCLLVSGVLKANENRAHALSGSQDALLMDALCPDSALLETGLFTGDIGHACVTGKVAESSVYIGYYDAPGAKMLQRTVLEGRLPERPGEIALEQSALDKLRLTAQIGDEISFDIVPIDGVKEARTWTLVGLLQDQADLLDLSRNVGGDVCLHWPSILLADDEPAFATGRTVQHMLLMLAPGVYRNETLQISMSDDTWMSTVQGMYAVMTGDGGVQFWDYDTRRFGALSPLAGELLFFLGGSAFVVVFLAALLAGALILATIVGISGAMEGTLGKRRETIGMLRCVGATRRQIRRIYGRESWLLALFTAPVAMALSCAFVYAASLVLPRYVAFHAPWWLIIPILLMTVAVVLIASTLPLRRASQVRPMSIVRDTNMLRKQKRIRSKGHFRLPGLISRRQTLFHPTREVGSACLTALMVLMVGVAVMFGFFMLGERVDFTKVRAFSLDGGRISYGQTYDTSQSSMQYSTSDTLQLESLPLVKQVKVSRNSSVNLLLDGEPPAYFLPTVCPVASADQIALLPECGEGIAQEYYDDCVKQLQSIQEYLGTDRKIVNLELMVMTVDPAELQSAVVSGDIDLKALDEGREVLVYAPTYYYQKRPDGTWSQSRKKRDRTWDFIQEDDYFVPGMTLDLTQVWQYADDLAAAIPVVDSYEGFNRTDAKVTVGAVLGGDAALELWDVSIITTERGAQALGLVSTLQNAQIYLSELPDEEGEAALARRIQTIGRRSNSQMYNYIASQRGDQQSMAYAMLVFVAVAVVLFAVAVGMVSGSVTRRIRADVRLIGTLRAVGADVRTLVKCYTGSLWTSLLLGAALGVAALTAFTLGYLRGSMNVTFWMAAASAAAIALFLSGAAMVCRLLITWRIREVTRRSIVENIREL